MTCKQQLITWQDNKLFVYSIKSFHLTTNNINRYSQNHKTGEKNTKCTAVKKTKRTAYAQFCCTAVHYLFIHGCFAAQKKGCSVLFKSLNNSF